MSSASEAEISGGHGEEQETRDYERKTRDYEVQARDYGMWATFTIEPRLCDVKVQNAHHLWGKFYRCPNKDVELYSADINEVEVSRDQSATICTCGRQGTASGAEGYFDLHDTESNNKIWYILLGLSMERDKYPDLDFREQ